MNIISTTGPECKANPSGYKSIASLPFVYFAKCGDICRWQVKSTEDYGLACEKGREYAAHFVQFLKEHPAHAGSNLLGNIAKDIDFKDESRTKGYWVGFFSYLERLIYMQAEHMDVFSDVAQMNAFFADLLRKSH